jgi:hypothetical protein
MIRNSNRVRKLFSLPESASAIAIVLPTPKTTSVLQLLPFDMFPTPFFILSIDECIKY